MKDYIMAFYNGVDEEIERKLKEFSNKENASADPSLLTYMINNIRPYYDKDKDEDFIVVALKYNQEKRDYDIIGLINGSISYNENVIITPKSSAILLPGSYIDIHGVYISRDERGKGLGNKIRKIFLEELKNRKYLEDFVLIDDFYLNLNKEIIKEMFPNKTNIKREELENLNESLYEQVPQEDVKIIINRFEKNPVKYGKKYLTPGSYKALIALIKGAKELDLNTEPLGIFPDKWPTLAYVTHEEKLNKIWDDLLYETNIFIKKNK